MKRIYAGTICFCSLASIALIAAALATESWVTITVQRPNATTDIGCIVTRTVGLFRATDVYQGCVLLDDEESFNTLSSPRFDVNAGLLYATIVLCALSILCALLATAVSGYNLFARPYETWAGPVGLLSYFSAGLIVDFIAIIMFVVTGFVSLNDTVPTCNEEEESFCKEEGYKQQGDPVFGYSFYLLVVAMFTFGLGIFVVMVAFKSLVKKMRNCCCPNQLVEDFEMNDGKDNDATDIIF